MTASGTVWERGRLDARRGPRQVLFGRMYEDAEIERAAFPPGGRVFCIASAACTAIALAPDHEVTAVDINPSQLAYAERRLEGGAGVRGRAERVMRLLRFFGPLVGWWPWRLRAFCELEDPAEQLAYWQRKLDTWRLRAALWLLFSLVALRLAYSKRLMGVLPKGFGAVLRARMARCFGRHPNRTNPYARALLRGELPPRDVPEAARAVRLVHDDAASFLERQPPESFDGFTLSNILDGADDAYRDRLFAAIERAAAPGAVTVLRTFAEPAEVDADANRAADDRSMLWGAVWVRPAAALRDVSAENT